MASGGWWWPSLGWASLPGLDSFTTRHWQRRLLRYVIKRTLAGFLKIPEDDIEQSTFLDADLGSGSVKLHDVELNQAAINELVSKQLGHDFPLQVSLQSGSISRVQILVGSSHEASNEQEPSKAEPSRPTSATERLFTAPIHVIAKDLLLDFRIDATPFEQDPTEVTDEDDTDSTLNLGASILQVADDYIHDGRPEVANPAEDGDEQPFGLPGGFESFSSNASTSQSALSEKQQVGLIANIIETLLGRLRLTVRNVIVNLRFASDLHLQVRMLHLRSRTETKTTGSTRILFRYLDVSGFDIHTMCTESIISEDHPTPDLPRASKGSTSSSSSASTGSSDDLAMSMAIADLRTSETACKPQKEGDLLASSTVSSVGGQSIYEDAESYTNAAGSFHAKARLPKEVPDTLDSGLPSEAQTVYGANQHILGLFPDEDNQIRPAAISVRLVKTYNSATSPSSPAPEHNVPRTLPPTTSLRVEVKMPLLALSVDTALLRSASVFSARLADRCYTHTSATSNEKELPRVSNTLVHVQVRALHFFGHLQPSRVDLAHLVQKVASLDTPPPVKMLFTYLQGIEGAYRLDGKDAKLAIHEFGICTSHRGSLRPLLLPDPGLLWQYDPDTLCAGIAQNMLSNTWPTAVRPVMNDWRCSLPATATSMTASTHLPLLQDAFAARMRDSRMTINIQPIHIWLEVEAVDELLQDILSAAATALGEAYPKIGPNPYASYRSSTRPKEQAITLSLTIPCLRVDIRCPMLPSATNAVYGDLRSGIFTLALHDMTYDTSTASEPAVNVTSLGLEIPHIFAFLAEGPGADMRKAFYAGKGSASMSAACKLHLHKVGAGYPAKHEVHIHVPSLDIVLDKSDIDAIQYLVDDITRATSRVAFLLDSAPTILSRARPEQIAGLGDNPGIKLSETTLEESHTKFTKVQLLFEKTQIRLKLQGSRFTLENSRSLDAEIFPLSVTIGLRQTANDELNLRISAGDVKLVDRSSSKAGLSERLLLRRIPGAKTPAAVVQLASSATEKRKCTKVSLSLSCLDANLSSDISLVDDLVAVSKLPPGEFLDVIPTDTTIIEMDASDITVKLVPRTLRSSVAVFCERMSLGTKLRQGAVHTKYKADVSNVQVWIADTLRGEDDRRRTFKDLGYAQLVHCQGVSAEMKARAGPVSTTALMIDVEQAHVTACPDTLLCLIAFVGDLQTPKEVRTKASSHTSAAISESTILPRQSGIAQEDVSSIPPMMETVSAVDGDTIEIANQGKIQLDRDWLYNVGSSTPKYGEDDMPTFSIRVKPTQLTIALFEGYDFDRTRAFVKSSVKATRRRLEKIKQLLAEGQMPEQTIEEIADPLLQSVFLPSRRDRSNIKTKESDMSSEEMDLVARIVAFDDELDQDDESENDSLIAWETLTDRPPAPRRGSSSSFRTPPPRPVPSSRLRRPRASAIDIHLSGLEVSMQNFNLANAMASRLHVRIGDFAIVDNIRTSTWNKFLTELRPRDGGITRPTGSPMVRIILKMLRTGDSADITEADLSAKVAPLRLHVDQDALDFFKTFFAFKMDPSRSSPDKPLADSASYASESDTSEGGFIQRVEIAAVKIKLDYKPKRVDYHALRQGRAIEMMNFFHFEASEMVLRHLVLSGIPSWAKVGDMLQEIWTPDVKANQLADFLAGINPVRSVVNVGHGFADLVLLPVAQYQKDGRLTRGLQRGGSRFAKSTAMEAIKLGARLATGTQVILEHAEHVLGGRIETPPAISALSTTPPLAEGSGRSEWLLTATEDVADDEEMDNRGSEVLSKFSQQPEDVKIGLQTAYKSLSGNVRSAAETILAVPMEVYERSNDGPVRAVVRAVPIAVLKPMIGASEAVSKTLLGLRNTLDPGAKEEVQDKYKGRSNAA